jgi:hypothetical protein
MDRTRAPWPIAIEAMGGAAAGAVVWRKQGRSFVTLVLKATYRLVPEGTLVPATALPVLAGELHHDDDPRRSLRAASDLAPYLRRVDVLLTGHACAPPTGPVQSGGVRLTLYRDEQCVLDKALLVQGDRAQDPSGRWFGVIPFQRIPLVYERATGSAEINPVGIDARFREPNLVHPRGWGLPACFGPVSRLWPSRRRYVAAFDPRGFEPPWLTLPDQLDERYFQAAPDDQQLELLRGDEWIVIEGMHPTLPRLRTRLPSARGVARVRGESPGSSRVLDLRADTLSIDMDRELCTLTFRAYLPLANEQVLPALRVMVEAELPGAVKPLIAGAPVAPAAAGKSRPPVEAPTAPVPTAPVPAQKSRPPAEAPGETAFVPSDLHAAARPAMPFAPVPSGAASPLARSSPSLDRSAIPQARPAKQDLGATIAAPGDEAPGAPVVMPFAPVHAAPAAMPFAPVAASPAPALTRSSMSLDRGAAGSRPPPAIDLGSTIVSGDDDAPAAPVVMPFAPVTGHAPSPFAAPARPSDPPPAAAPGETLFVPGDLPRARAATPFEGVVVPPPRPQPIAAHTFDQGPESAIPLTLPLPDAAAPLPFASSSPPPMAAAPLPFASSPPPPMAAAPLPVSAAPPAPPPLLTVVPAPAVTDDAPLADLGALFLGALPLPPEAPKKSARRRRDDDAAPRVR